MITSTMYKLRIPTDEEYLTDFHKQWNEACMRALEQMPLTRFSHEYLKEQSQKFAEKVRKAEEEQKRQRK